MAVEVSNGRFKCSLMLLAVISTSMLGMQALIASVVTTAVLTNSSISLIWGACLGLSHSRAKCSSTLIGLMDAFSAECLEEYSHYLCRGRIEWKMSVLYNPSLLQIGIACDAGEAIIF